MLTVALVGGDGAGKTTVARRLEKTSPFPIKYMYMGLSTLSSSLALPTSRLFLAFRLRTYKKAIVNSGKSPPEAVSYRDLASQQQGRRGRMWATARFLNRLGEAWFRYLVALSYQIRGYVILCDRHFLFDTAPGVIGTQAEWQPPSDRLFHWIMGHLYPKPDLTIFLDAPSEVLYDRKKEGTPDSLDRRRGAILEVGRDVPKFVRVDAAQSLDQVVADVAQYIMEFRLAARRPKTASGDPVGRETE